MSTDDVDHDPLADRLRRERPAPAAGFRGNLGRWVQAQHAPARPVRLGLAVACCLGTGLLLLLVALLGLGGSGPLG